MDHHNGPNIALLQSMLGEINSQHNTVVFLNHSLLLSNG